MKTRKIYLMLLFLGLLACNNEDHTVTFYYSVYDGENASLSVPGATVKVYTNANAWLTNQAPIKTYTTDANGSIKAFDTYVANETIVYAEYGIKNNWPDFLTDPLTPDQVKPNITSGGSSIYTSFLSDFQSIAGNTFLLTDVLVNGASIFNNVDICSKDNYLKLQLNGKLFYSEGSNICVGKSASQEYSLGIPLTKSTAGTTVVNGNTTYQMNIIWADVGNLVYISTDFTKVYFQAGTAISVYTKQ